MEGEADDQHGGERDLPGAGGDADGQALGEIVEPDRRGGGEAHLQGAAASEASLPAEHRLIFGREHVHRAAGNRGRAGRRRAHPAFQRRKSRRAGREAGAEQRDQPDRLTDALLALLEGLDRLLDDPEGVLEDVGEQEREHADREHRQRNPLAVAHRLEAPERKPQEDREAGQRSE